MAGRERHRDRRRYRPLSLGDSLPRWYAQTLPATHEPARGILRVSSITPSMLSPFVEEGALTDVTGRIDAVVALTATSLDAVHRRGDHAERAELSLARIPLNQVRPTRLGLADGRLQVLDWTWAGAGNRVNVSGGALLTGASPTLDFALDGTLDLRMLSAFSRDVATTGRAAFDVKVTGLADQPLVDGRMSIQNGGLVMREPRLAITDLQGTVTFARDALQFGNITANANGGTLRVTGNIQYPKFAITGGAINNQRPRARGRSARRPSHRNRCRLPAQPLGEGAYADRKPHCASRLVSRAGEPGRSVADRQSRRNRPFDSGSEAGFFDRIPLEIDVKTAEELVVDNNYGQLDMAANLQDRRHDRRACSYGAIDDWRRRERVPRRPHVRGGARHRGLHERHARRAEYRSCARDAGRRATTSRSK